MSMPIDDLTFVMSKCRMVNIWRAPSGQVRATGIGPWDDPSQWPRAYATSAPAAIKELRRMLET